MCTVKYNGEIGVDCTVTFGDRKTFIEIKTCNKIVKNNIRRKEGSPTLFNEVNLGRFRFDKKQHQELLEKDGWYLFYVSGVIFGVKAKEMCLFEEVHPDEKKKVPMSWLHASKKSYPDWLRRLKVQVYGI